MKTKNNQSILVKGLLFCSALILLLSSCNKMDYYYKDLVEMGDRIYVGKPDSTWVSSGNKRLKVGWLNPSDPNATKISAYWNNNRDSIIADIDHSKDRGHLYIEGLEEGAYTVNVFTGDNKGNRSVPIERNAEVYGDNFQQALRDRDISHAVILRDSTVIFWDEIFEEDPIVSSEVMYFDLDGQAQKAVIAINARQVSLYNVDTTREISVRSNFLPEPTAVDTFRTEFYEDRLFDLQRHSLTLRGTGSSNPDFIDFAMVTVHDNTYAETNPARIDMVHLRGKNSRHNFISISNSSGLGSFSSGLRDNIEGWDVRNETKFINLGDKATNHALYNGLDENDRVGMKAAFEDAAANKSPSGRLTKIDEGDIVLLHSVDRDIYVAIKVTQEEATGIMAIEFKISRY